MEKSKLDHYRNSASTFATLRAMERQGVADIEAAFEAVLSQSEVPLPRACACAIPDPVMQADSRFYCDRGDLGGNVLIALDCDLVGEAYFNPKAQGGTWWWSGTMDGEYADSPIHSTVTHWMPLPDPPSAAAIRSETP